MSFYLQYLPLKFHFNFMLTRENTTAALTETSRKTQPIVLTRKEFQLGEYFMRHPEQIIISDRLFTQLWELETETTSNVVPAQVRLLRKK